MPHTPVPSAAPASLLPALFACLPFALLLACVALGPLLAATRHAWEKNRTQWLVAGTLGLFGALAQLALRGDGSSLVHALCEYAAFVAMLAALYAACGGIHVTGAFAGFPTTNTLLLAVGAVLASFIGTTGAAMLLVRPLLRANADRKHKTHVFVFFIFVVANCGGLLLPMGDPPLFIGFLRGVPFFWTAVELVKPWLLVNGLLLGIFLAVDTRVFLRETLLTRGRMMKAVAKVERPLMVRGWKSVAHLVAVPAGMVLVSAWLRPPLGDWLGEGNGALAAQGIQIAWFAAIALAAARTARFALGHETRFSWAPVKEVAAVFFGIFLAMAPALALLREQAEHLPLSSPWHYFFATGGLSALLDNAPTYAAFGELAAAKTGAATLGDLVRTAPALLAAISCGAVFFGAMTYIGNGPNFMVKAVCENHRVKMPSFFGFLGWSCAVLLPVLGVVAWLCV